MISYKNLYCKGGGGGGGLVSSCNRSFLCRLIAHGMYMEGGRGEGMGWGGGLQALTAAHALVQVSAQDLGVSSYTSFFYF